MPIFILLTLAVSWDKYYNNLINGGNIHKTANNGESTYFDLWFRNDDKFIPEASIRRGGYLNPDFDFTAIKIGYALNTAYLTFAIKDTIRTNFDMYAFQIRFNSRYEDKNGFHYVPIIMKGLSTRDDNRIALLFDGDKYSANYASVSNALLSRTANYGNDELAEYFIITRTIAVKIN